MSEDTHIQLIEQRLDAYIEYAKVMEKLVEDLKESIGKMKRQLSCCNCNSQMYYKCPKCDFY